MPSFTGGQHAPADATARTKDGIIDLENDSGVCNPP